MTFCLQEDKGDKGDKEDKKDNCQENDKQQASKLLQQYFPKKNLNFNNIQKNIHIQSNYKNKNDGSKNINSN